MRLKLAITLAASAAVCFPPASLAQESASRLEALKAKGPNAEVTVFPGLLGGRVFPQVGEALAMMLERAGMEKLELSSQVFQRAEPATMEQATGAFGDFVRTHPVSTEYALYAEFLGAPATGFSEVRGILVDRGGNTVWVDRQTPEDAEFQKLRPREPMECILLLVSRLRGTLGLQDPLRPDAPEGRIAQRAAEKTGLPTEAERAAMKKGLEAARTRFGSSKVTVFPVLIGGRTDRAQATHLARLLSGEKLGEAEVAEGGPVLGGKPDMNEQKMLWDMARAFREYVRQTPPTADYAVYAEYMIDLKQGRTGAVHFAVCDRSGEWVIVDFQNDHHEDFQGIAPKSGDDCDRLLVKRLARRLH